MTDNHSYNLPEKGAEDWDVPLNNNFERLDRDVEVRDEETQLDDYTPRNGAKFFATDTGAVYIGTGDEWIEVPLHVQSRTSDPSGASLGQLWYRTDNDNIRIQTADGPQTLQLVEDETDDGSDDGASSEADELLQMDGSSTLDHYTEFHAGNGSSNWTLKSDQSVSQDQSLHGWIHAGQSWASNVKWDLGSEDYASNVDEWHQRFYFRLGDGFDMNDNENCRIFNTALADGPNNSGGGQPTGDDGWSERLYVTERGSRNRDEWNLLSYTYHMDQGGSYGELTTIDNVGLTTGDWHQIDCYCKVNTYSGGSANSDGIVRYWFNGEQVQERTNLRFTTSDDNRIQWGGPILFYGGGYNAPTDVLAWYDNHEIWVNDDGPQ